MGAVNGNSASAARAFGTERLGIRQCPDERVGSVRHFGVRRQSRQLRVHLPFMLRDQLTDPKLNPVLAGALVIRRQFLDRVVIMVQAPPFGACCQIRKLACCGDVYAP